METLDRAKFCIERTSASHDEILDSNPELTFAGLYTNYSDHWSIVLAIHEFFKNRHRNQPYFKWSITSKLTHISSEGYPINADRIMVNLIEVIPDTGRAERFELVFGVHPISKFFIHYYDEQGQRFSSEYENYSSQLMVMILGDRLGYFRGAGH